MNGRTIAAAQELRFLIADVLASADGCESCVFEVIGEHLCSREPWECPYQTSMGIVRRLERALAILEGRAVDDG